MFSRLHRVTTATLLLALASIPAQAEPISTVLGRKLESRTMRRATSLDTPFAIAQTPTPETPPPVEEPTNEASPTEDTPPPVEEPTNETSPTEDTPPPVEEPTNEASPTEDTPPPVEEPTNETSPTEDTPPPV
ncbi:MAG: hypothetical protein SW833_18640, partial [Cyanobacteriota bacterium]|nr:hypothetical protein [Cyanobacteriota bacterium]